MDRTRSSLAPPLTPESPRPMLCSLEAQIPMEKEEKNQAIFFAVWWTVPQLCAQGVPGACHSDVKSRLRDQDGFREEAA